MNINSILIALIVLFTLSSCDSRNEKLELELYSLTKVDGGSSSTRFFHVSNHEELSEIYNTDGQSVFGEEKYGSVDFKNNDLIIVILSNEFSGWTGEVNAEVARGSSQYMGEDANFLGVNLEVKTGVSPLPCDKAKKSGVISFLMKKVEGANLNIRFRLKTLNLNVSQLLGFSSLWLINQTSG